MNSFCTNCGKEISEGARFCPFCGAPIESETENFSENVNLNETVNLNESIINDNINVSFNDNVSLNDPAPIIMPDPIIDNIGPSINSEPIMVQPVFDQQTYSNQVPINPVPVVPVPVNPAPMNPAGNYTQYNNAAMVGEERRGGSGLNIASMILGIISVLFCCGILGGYLGLFFSVPAVVLGIIGLAKKAPLKGMAIAGIICGGIGLILCFIGGAFSCVLAEDYGSFDFYDFFDILEEIFDL